MKSATSRCTTKKPPRGNVKHFRDAVDVERHQISRHMDRLACLRMRRRRSVSTASMSLGGVRLGLTCLLAATESSCRGVESVRRGHGGSKSRFQRHGSWCCNNRTSAGEASATWRGQHLIVKPVAVLPSRISSEPRRASARFGRGAGERERERVRERGREDCTMCMGTVSKKVLMPWATVSSSNARDARCASYRG